MTWTGPKLSLGIPVHNGAAYLAQLFDCLRAQTLTDFEAIIRDNSGNWLVLVQPSNQPFSVEDFDQTAPQ